MSVGHPLIWWLATAISSAVLTRVVLWWAAREGWLDPPIERSSHESPTPSRGGIAIVLVCVVALSMILPGEVFRSLTWVVVVVAIGAIAAIGLWDDFRPLPVAPRLLVHFAAVGVILAALGGTPPLVIASVGIPSGIIATFVVALALVWFVNLYNFMDGIDGIAATEAIFIGLMAALISIDAKDLSIAAAWAVVAGSASGFLIWNWAPARIFMGDVGSGFLGIIISTLLMVSVGRGVMSANVALILTAPFVCDATLTLMRRVLRGESWTAGHRVHAYQWLARRWGSHSRVVFAMTALNLTVGLGALQLLKLLPPWSDLITALTLLVWLAVLWLAGAGRPETMGR